jgi:general secretion pathway protein D
VRESVLTSVNTRAIDTGTLGNIELRRSDTPLDRLFPESAQAAAAPVVNPTTAANAANAMVQQMKQQVLPPTPGAAAPPPAPYAAAPPPASNAAASASLQPVSLAIAPPNSTQTLGSTFTASVVLTNAHDVFSVPLQVGFDPKILQLVNVEAGGLLGGDGQPVALVHRDDGNGLVTITASRPPGVGGVNGNGQVCTLTFKAIGAGDTNIALVKVGAKNSIQANLPAVGAQGVVHVK